ncbi:hypothetical protein [Kibdelosporangium aridum]|uniref:hypothetical protein n=1 Tax=Kibdelosporangium aridum TaxID=2030 RepID=UPI0035EA8CF9
MFESGLASVKHGNLYAGWLDQAGDAAKIEVDAPTGRVGVLRTNGSLTVKDGGPHGAWTEQTNGVSDFQLTNY